MDHIQMQMLRDIQILEFTAIELTLYLDTHPDEKAPLDDYNKTAEKLNGLKLLYEKTYGPLMAYGFSPSPYPWRWIEGPWPWEITL